MSSLLSRRRFLKGAALAGVGPLILPSAVRGAATSPNSQIGVGFIGLGMQGINLLLNCLDREEVRVVGLCDVDVTRRLAARGRVEKRYTKRLRKDSYQGCSLFGDFRELIACKGIDAVLIATPDHWHALASIAAVRAGKDIYCEKPVSHTVEEGRAMVKAVRQYNRVCQVGTMQRSMSEFRHACELVRNGVIGKIATVEVGVGGPPVPCDLPGEAAEPGLDWDFWLGPSPLRPYNSALSPRGVPNSFPKWRDYIEYGAGGIGDWGAHHFDIVQWALGFDGSGPVEFLPASDPRAREGVRFRYSTGVEVIHRPYGSGIVFHGSEGRLHVDRERFHLWIGEKLKTDDFKSAGQVAKELLPATATRLYDSGNHVSDWLASVRTQRRPICDIEIGHRSATICELVNLTYQHHQRLLWDPARERFVGGTGKIKWLGRDYRRPWKLATD